VGSGADTDAATGDEDDEHYEGNGRGAEMIEFAIVVVLLMTLLYGIITSALRQLTIRPMYALTPTMPGDSVPVFHAAGVDSADGADLGSDGDTAEVTA
jgi:hypothetical protein